MVFKRFRRVGVFAETFVLLVVVGIDAVAGPVFVALDAEMVVALCGKTRQSGTALKQSLRQGDARRNAVLLLVAHCQWAPLLDVSQIVHRQRLGVG